MNHLEISRRVFKIIERRTFYLFYFETHLTQTNFDHLNH